MDVFFAIQEATLSIVDNDGAFSYSRCIKHSILRSGTLNYCYLYRSVVVVLLVPSYFL